MNEVLTEKELQKFADIAYKETGIHIPAQKLSFMQNRLSRRLRELGLPNYQAYYDYLHQKPEEMPDFVEAITTNETYFFRCPRHFYLLSKEILPQISTPTVDIWSAACSTGAEPYSIAIVLRERVPNFFERKVRIFASDIDRKALKKASDGIFDSYAIRLVKEDMLQKYFTTIDKGRYQIASQLRDMLLLGQHNLKQLFPKGKMDVVFCRNVLIYFDNDSKEIVFRNLLSALKPGGYLFLGESEIIPPMSGVQRIESSVARKK